MVAERSGFWLAVRSALRKNKSRYGSKQCACPTQWRLSLSRLADRINRSTGRREADAADWLRGGRLSDLRTLWIYDQRYSKLDQSAALQLSSEARQATRRPGKPVRWDIR